MFVYSAKFDFIYCTFRIMYIALAPIEDLDDPVHTNPLHASSMCCTVPCWHRNIHLNVKSYTRLPPRGAIPYSTVFSIMLRLAGVPWVLLDATSM